jgi:hypothetical protein
MAPPGMTGLENACRWENFLKKNKVVLHAY